MSPYVLLLLILSEETPKMAVAEKNVENRSFKGGVMSPTSQKTFAGKTKQKQNYLGLRCWHVTLETSFCVQKE